MFSHEPEVGVKCMVIRGFLVDNYATHKHPAVQAWLTNGVASKRVTVG
jgi:hypothetical protein